MYPSIIRQHGLKGEATKNNINIRKIRKATVANYARQMADGIKHYSWDCIAFDKDGNLLNGQHRLLACVKSNTSFYAFVITNAENITGDTGLKRTVVEELRGRGLELSSDYSSNFAVAVLRDIAAVYFGKRNASSDECFEISKLPTMNKCNEVIRIINSCIAGVGKACVASAIIGGYLISKDERCIEFCEALKTGVSNDKSAGVVIALRDFLMTTKGATGGTKNQSSKDIRLIVQGSLRSYLNGNTGKRIRKPDNLIYVPTEEMFEEEW